MIDKDLKAKYEDDVSRKANAEKILNNPFHAWAFGVLEMSYYDEMSNTKFDEVEKREALYVKMKAMKDLKKLYKKVLQDGKLAENELTRLQKVVRPFKKALRM